VKLPRAAAARLRADPRRAGWAYVVQAIIAYGIAYISAQLAAKKKGPLDDDKPTTLTTRGSYTSWLLGVRQVGPVVAWAGARGKRKEKVEGGKGLSSPKQDVYYESAWHLLAVGPVNALKAIYQQGEVIFEGPITSDSHPSGTTIDLGQEGAFTIYWGEQTQPIDANVANYIGVSSRWPRCCFIWWHKKRLGPVPSWPILLYELEKRPTGTFLSSSQSWYLPTATASGNTYAVTAFVANANPDVGYIEIDGYDLHIPPGLPVALTGNALPNGDYTVRRAVELEVQIGTSTDFEGNMNPIYGTRTRLFLEAGTVGADANGNVGTYNFAQDDGANIAHCVADMLFAQWPDGLGLDPAGLEPWDLQSLEDWGVEAEALGLRSSVLISEGRTVADELGSILLDHGVLLPLDTLNDGKLTFRRVREPVSSEAFTSDHYSDEPPEREILIGDKQVNRMTFTFTDRERDWADNTITIRDDGAISDGEFFRARDVRVSSSVHFATCSILAQQRAAEQLGQGAKFSLKMTRKARLLVPGDTITIDDIDDVLRVLEVHIDPLTEVVTVEVMPDTYGVPRTDYSDVQGGGTSGFLPAEQDLFVDVEIPEALLTAEEMRISVLRIRKHAQVTSAAIWASADNSTFTLLGEEAGSAAGGFLDVGMSAADPYFQAQGPTYQAFGVDEDSLLDLTGDDLSWSRGRQVAVFRGPNNDVEVCFVRKVTALGGGQYRLDGLMRARYDTRRLEVSAGAEVYIFANDEFETFADLLLVPDGQLYTKSQPTASGGVIPLASIPSTARTQQGKGLVPISAEALYVSAPAKGSPSYVASADVTVRWGWSSSSSLNTGAGYQAAGTAIGAPTIKGSFLVQLRTSGGTLVSEQTTTTPEVTYTAAELAAAPISGTSFRVRVYQVYNGYTSDPAELLVTKV
jgi:hypothetical protein